MPTSIGDVASAAGVSRATASRALTGHPAVLPETRERVLRAAESLRYRVDPVARALRAGSSNLLGLVVSNLHNPSIQEIAEAIQAEGQTEGYDVLIATTNDDPARERRLLEALAGRRVDGIICMSSGANTTLVNALHADGLPVVEVIRLPPSTATPSIVYDDRRAGVLATRHLLSLGHRRIAFLGGPADTRSGAERHHGFVSALAEAGTAPDPTLVHRGAFTPDFGVASIEALLTRRSAFTGLVVANHEAMFSALQALSRSGVAIPADLSVVVIEDDPLLPWWHPAITAVDVRPGLLAGQALAMLLAQIREPDGAPGPRVAADLVLIERESTGAPADPFVL